MHQQPFGGLSPPGAAGELTALPRPLAGFLRGLATGKGEGKGREEKGEWKRSGRKGRGRGKNEKEKGVRKENGRGGLK